MQPLKRLRFQAKALFAFDPNSLRTRLTLAVAIVSAVGLGSVACWVAWKMQYTLVSAHKTSVEEVVTRLPEDLKSYMEIVEGGTTTAVAQSEIQGAIEAAIADSATDSTMLWVKNPQGEIIARSQPNGDIPRSAAIPPPGLNQIDFPWGFSRIERVDEQYWAICASPLQYKGEFLGNLYIAQNVNKDHVLFITLIRNLGVASVLSIAVVTVASVWLVRRCLLPLRRIGRISETISAEQLGEAQISLENAPTEVKQLAQTLDKMLLRLFDAWEQQRQFVSNVSHELRTPLTIVSGYLQSVRRRGANLNEPQQEALAIAASEADRTIQLLQDLLTLARADSGYMHFQLEMVELGEFLKHIVEITGQYSQRQIQLKLPSESVYVKADRNRLTQVLLNLIDNAVKYSDEGQPIGLRLRSLGRDAQIEVRDRGVGIGLQQQARIFERFYRVDEARARTTGGTGLGLSIVKTLVEGMGGRVGVSSKLGEGSTFTVSLPSVKETVT